MKLLLIILLIPFTADAQSWVVHNDSLFYKINSDSIYFNSSPLHGTFWTYIKATPTTLSGYGITNGQSSITTGTTAQYFKGDLSLATFPTTTAPFSNSTDKNFVTDAQATVIGNTSNANSGDNASNSLYSSLITNATHTGDATGATALTVVKINGTSLAGLATGILKNTTTTGVPSIAIAADFPTLNQNTTGSAATLTTARTLWGVSFNGSANLTGPFTTYNGTSLVGSGLPSIVAQVNSASLTGDVTATTLLTPSAAGFYRVNVYIAVITAGSVSSTMPAVNISYTDGNAGTNVHTSIVTATSTTNSVTTAFAQATYVLYAKASTAIQYSTSGYASSAAGMAFALRIKMEAL